MKVEDGRKIECEHCWCEEAMDTTTPHKRCCNCGLKKKTEGTQYE